MGVNFQGSFGGVKKHAFQVETHVRYVGVLFNYFSTIEHLDLIGVWLGEDQRIKAIKALINRD